MSNLSPETARILSASYMSTLWRRFFGLNLSRIDQLLYVGGEFRAAQWSAMHRLGIRAVLSLQAERADTFSEPPPERTLRLMVPDFHAPTLEQLAEGVAFIAQAHAAQLPVLVHCRAGVGRAPTTAAAYLVAHHSMTSQEAVTSIYQARPIIGMNIIQMQRLRQWEQQQRLQH
ncbi:MAG: dual specificity protein phosphatase family protein [Chloroflexaceae bacterium]|nr:dual specificity protein phosphatase family protein [Chloroflexaceae bacterium]